MSTTGHIKGPSHEKGGIGILVKETSQKKWVEGGEYLICKEAIESDNIHYFQEKTNKEILNYFHKEYDCPGFKTDLNADDFIICKLTVNDTTKRTIKGTVQRILDVIQAEKGCTVSRGSMSFGSEMAKGGPIDNKNKSMTSTEQELQKAVSDLHKAETTQKMMKDTNAIIRSKKDVTKRLISEAGLSEANAEKVQSPDRFGRVGFPTYSLTNNNANIKRLQARVKMLENKVQGAKAAEKGMEEKYTFDGGTIDVNYDLDRVQIFYDNIPTSDQRNDLKRSGWHWSPTNKAWQRKITPQAIRSAVYMLKATKVESQLEKGIEVEQEHKETLEKISKGQISVKEAIKETAEAHLEEDPEYYDKLAEIEGKKSTGATADFDVTSVPESELTVAQRTAKLALNTIAVINVKTPNVSHSNKDHTVRLDWPEHNMYIAIDDKRSPIAPGVYFSHDKTGISYGLNDWEKAIKDMYERWQDLHNPKKTKEIVLEPNTGDEFDEVIMSQLDPHDNWLGNEIKERAVKQQIFEKLSGPKKDKEEAVKRIYKNFYNRTLLKEGRADLMTKDQKVAYKQMNLTGKLAGAMGKSNEPVYSNDDPFNGIGHNYKNQYELNKAIESMLTHKGDDHTSYTSDEKNFIRKYSGYGGLDKYGTTGKGGLFEYYTPRDVIEKMWALAYKYGYNNGPVLEPSVATGEFLQFAKPETRVVGYEISLYSSVICKILYPTAEIHLQAFEQTFIKNNWTMKDNIDSLEKFDLVIGNPPYGDFSTVESRYMSGMGEKDHTKARNYVEYFIRRGLDLLKPKGLLIYIVGAQVKNGGTLFLDSGNSPVKEYLFQNSELLDAYRLPDSIFERTGVTSEIIVLQKS
jgi:N-6 DNA Methylase